MIIGSIGSVIASIFGGWDADIALLIAAVIIDYVTGLIVGGVFHNSPKSANGSLESKAGFKGLCRKAVIALFVFITYRLDLALGIDYIRTTVCIGFTVNELISITENAGLMGIPIPKIVIKAIDMLKSKSESEGE